MRSKKLLLVILSMLMSTIGCAIGGANIDDSGIVKQKQFDADMSTLSYIQRDGKGEAIVVFLHGTPGGAEAFSEYLQQPWLVDRSKLLLSIDRPGWGLSQLSVATKKVLPLAEQSQLIAKLLLELDDQYNQAPIVVVGHSLGGALVVRLLGDYPELIDAGLVLAGPIDPELSGTRWYHNAAKLWPIKTLIGSKLRQSNLEMLMLGDDVAASVKNYSYITMPITVIQGVKDKLVNSKNVDMAHQQWSQATIVSLPDSGHFLPWQQQSLIVNHINQLIDLASIANND